MLLDKETDGFDVMMVVFCTRALVLIFVEVEVSQGTEAKTSEFFWYLT